jgi:hypothetical protein
MAVVRRQPGTEQLNSDLLAAFQKDTTATNASLLSHIVQFWNLLTVFQTRRYSFVVILAGVLSGVTDFN